MIKLLLKLFVKDYNDTTAPAVRSAIGRMAGVVGIVCNILLTIGKVIIGLMSGSMAIVIDGINNLSDAASSVITLIGFKMARKPADKEHPYGHARFEYIASLAIAGMMLFVGVNFVKSSIDKIIKPDPLGVTVATMAVLIISIAVKLWMAFFFRKLGKSIESTTLTATSVDSRNDAIITSSVLAGCLLNYFFDLNIDGYIGLGVSLLIFYSGIKMAKDTVSPLIGRKADKDIISQMSDIISEHKKVLGFHDLLIHDYGPGECYASVHVEMSGNETALECHDVIDDIENEVLDKMNIHLVIHCDPVEVED